MDYNDDFQLYMTTRNSSLELPTYAASIITKINFKTTEAGLKGQVCSTQIILLLKKRLLKCHLLKMAVSTTDDIFSAVAITCIGVKYP